MSPCSHLSTPPPPPPLHTQSHSHIYTQTRAQTPVVEITNEYTKMTVQQRNNHHSLAHLWHKTSGLWLGPVTVGMCLAPEQS